MKNNCPINSDNRTKCQECRWQLCIKAGMDIECKFGICLLFIIIYIAVLDDKERKAKNELIKMNRLKRKQASLSSSISQKSSLNDVTSSQESLDKDTTKEAKDPHKAILLALIDTMTEAFKKAFMSNEVNF